MIRKEKTETLSPYSKQKTYSDFRKKKHTVHKRLESAKYVLSVKQTCRVLGYIHWIHPPQKGI